jgi:selenocysteine lyase/cysteine desulfurase
VPFTGYGDSAFVRISGQAYNAPSDYERLAEALRREFR